jgi:hypothetical protein
MQKIRALEDMYCDSRQRYKGELFELPEQFAKVLVLIGKAENAEQEAQQPREPTPPPEPKPPPPPPQVMSTQSAEEIVESPPKKKRYMRRDMRAED